MNLSKIRRFKPFLAPRRISWIDPDTQRRFIARNKGELVQKIVTYRVQNELPPIENMNLVLENYWASLVENKHLTEEVTLERGWMTYLKGGITLIKTMLFDAYVAQEEADRRSDICVDCPHNVNPKKNTWDTWADATAEHTIGDRRSKNHDKIFNCEICTCLLRSKVWIDEPLELSKEEIMQLPDFCWQRPLIKQ